MKIPKVTFEKRAFELRKISQKELLDTINEYFIKAPSRSSPGDKEFVTGEVRFNDLTFNVKPIITDWWIRAFEISAYGTVMEGRIEIRFQTSVLRFIIPFAAYGMFLLIFFSQVWISIAWLTIPFLFLLFLFNFFLARKQYKKDRQNHLDFLEKILIAKCKK